MASLARDLRRELERTVRQARRVAETGAAKVLEQLAVNHHEPWSTMTPEQRALRNRLRAHGRQLGDRRDAKRGTQGIGRLTQECAYEHWHRMLFARFLAENDLLIEPESGVAITLDEARELAREKGADWLELASDYAERMLPQIFRKDDPVLAVTLPAETRSELEDLLKGLPREVFLADDSLGWVYQFWQADRKEEVNRSEKKIGADELPAVTQLFTEDYMVLFLLHNTLGAWWAGKVLAERPELATSARSEDDLRAACRVGDVGWTYLRFVRDQTDDGAEGPWRPAAGAFDGWPRAAKDITVLDPCMGSGHFLVFALPILVAFRMAEEGLTREAAVEAVLRDNLFGLEIDQRCTQIAAFNLAFAAWRMVGYRPLPALNLACSGLSLGVTKAEWLKLAERIVEAADLPARRDLLGVESNIFTAGLEARARGGLETLYDLFAQAPALGSLIEPRRAGGDIFREGFDKLAPLLSQVLQAAEGAEEREMAVAAQGMAKAADLLAKSFTLTVTNVPYLTRQAQSDKIRKFCEYNFSRAKADLSTCFIERALSWASEGTVSVVSPTNWHYQPAYKKFRGHLLETCEWNTVLRLGAGAFDAISGEVVNISLCVLSHTDRIAPKGNLGFWIDASDARSPADKAAFSANGSLHAFCRVKQKAHPDKRIILADLIDAPTLSKCARSLTGTRTADNLQFLRGFWELETHGADWEPLQSTVKATVPFGGREQVIHWQQNAGKLRELANLHVASIQGAGAWGKRGVCVSLMGRLPVTLYSGKKYDMNCGVVWPADEKDLPALWAYLSSQEYSTEVRKIDNQLKLTTATLLKVPFDLAHWQKVAAEKYPNGLPEPYSDDSTQWLFHGHPCGSVIWDEEKKWTAHGPLRTDPTVLQVALARLLGYRWPAERDPDMRLAAEAREWVARAAALSAACPADDDGVVCLSATMGEAPAHERLTALLAHAYGAEWSAAKLATILEEAGFAGRTLDDWLRDGFFEQHCKLFHQRPFIWHIWDGRRDGFHALVNYHRLAAPNGKGRRTLEKLIYSYLGDWIDRQRAEQKAGVEGADARLAHAEHLRAELIKILEGEPPYDIFVRWKPLHEQPIGWEPDINDGVRMNIRPFMTARPLNARARTACILRATPKIKWGKDRGKEPSRDRQDYPWFWGWDPDDSNLAIDFTGGAKFDGNRWNDLHYTRAFKQAARDRQAAGRGGRS